MQVDSAEREGLTKIFGDSLSSIPTITTIPFTGNCMAGNGGISIGVAAKAIQEQTIPARLGAETTPGIDAGQCDSQQMNINKVLIITAGEGGQCVAHVLGRMAS
jgi:3-oxoacyl-(acyl-carrier-protein) synthase